MKSRLTLIFAALVVLLGGMVWVMQDRLTGVTPPPASANSTLLAHTNPVIAPAPAAAAVFTIDAAGTSSASQVKSPPMVRVDASGNLQYIARDGDTASQLAIALLGSDSREHRDAVIAANVSLQAQPDRVLTGQSYSIAPAIPHGVDEAETDEEPNATTPAPSSAVKSKDGARAAKWTAGEKAQAEQSAQTAGVAGSPKLKYTAQRGDTVSGLAANLLGGNTSENRSSIIAGNASLKQDPDHMVAGKNYTIAAPNGLAADPDARPAKAPTTQPDADDVVRLGEGRSVRYTAEAGDTVSKLAITLLGSDSAANRELIVKSNPSLKQDPDHLVAGQTYWIVVPPAESSR